MSFKSLLKKVGSIWWKPDLENLSGQILIYLFCSSKYLEKSGYNYWTELLNKKSSTNEKQ